ncbi:hypothetical protein [Rhodanobacter umsongensis]
MNGIGYLRMADAACRIVPDLDVHSCEAFRLALYDGNVSLSVDSRCSALELRGGKTVCFEEWIGRLLATMWLANGAA